MSNNRRILIELEAAIDRMDMDAVERHLVNLKALEPGLEVEDTELFAARILEMDKRKTKESQSL